MHNERTQIWSTGLIECNRRSLYTNVRCDTAICSLFAVLFVRAVCLLLLRHCRLLFFTLF